MTDIRKRILESNDLQLTKMHVAEWGTDVYLRPMTARERTKFVTEINNKVTKAKSANQGDVALDLACSQITRVVCDEDGQPIFSEEDAEALSNKNGAVIERISQRILVENKIVPGAVEDELKN